MTFVKLKKDTDPNFIIVNKEKTHSFLCLRNNNGNLVFVLSSIATRNNYEKYKEYNVNDLPRDILRKMIAESFENELAPKVFR